MKFATVAKWEFLEKVKSKAFLISLVIMPVMMILFGVLPGLLASNEEDKPSVVGVYDETNSILQPLANRLEEKFKLPNGQPRYIIRNLWDKNQTPEGTKAVATALLASKDIEGYFTIPATVFDSGTVVYKAPNVGNVRIQERFSRAIEEVIVERRLSGQGLDPEKIRKLMARIDVRSVKIDEKGQENESSFLETFFSAYIVIMMLLFLVLTSGQLLIRSVVEEKSSRVIEVLLSSCSSQDLMAGKILGLSGLGIVQLLLWGLIGLAVTLKTGTHVFTAEHMLLSLVYFALGYLLYAGVFVAAGSPVTTEQEAQQLTQYVSMVLVFPIVLAFSMMQNPDSTLVKVLSFVPLLTPTFMVMRIAIQMPAPWEIMATIGLLVVSTVFTMWAAGRIFRIAILSYGKRPTIPELIRWARTP